MQDQITKEEARREANRKWLKDIANNVLPFIILSTQLEELRTQNVLKAIISPMPTVSPVSRAIKRWFFLFDIIISTGLVYRGKVNHYW